MPKIGDDSALLLFALTGLLCSVVFLCFYLQEKRKALEPKTPLCGLGTFLLYVFLIAFVVLVCLGSAVAFDTGNPQILIPLFAYGLAVIAALLWRREKKVRR